MLVSGYLLNFINHACILISYAYAHVQQPPAEEVIYEVVAEPQGKPRSRRIVGSRPKSHLTLARSSKVKASPGAHPII